MRRILVAGIAALAVVLAAAIPRTSSAVTIGIELFGGWTQYALGDFNDSLKVFNEVTGLSLADITDGTTGGLGLRIWPTENLLLRATADVLLADTEDQGVTFDITSGVAEFGATYFFPTSSSIRLGLGGGIGIYTIVGTLEGPGGSFDLSGEGFGVHGMGEAMLPLGKRFSLSGILGYRLAKVDDVKINLGGGFESSLDTEADFSGVMLRFGIAFEGSIH